MEIKELQEMFEKEFNSFKELLKQQDAEIKKNGEATKTTADSIEKAGEVIEELQAEMKTAQDKLDKDSAAQAKRLEEVFRAKPENTDIDSQTWPRWARQRG